MKGGDPAINYSFGVLQEAERADSIALPEPSQTIPGAVHQVPIARRVSNFLRKGSFSPREGDFSSSFLRFSFLGQHQSLLESTGGGGGGVR